MERKQHKNSDDTVKTITRPKTIVHEYFANDYYYYDHTNKFHVSNESNDSSNNNDSNINKDNNYNNNNKN